MMIPAPSPGTNSTDAAADESEQPTSDAPDWPLGARPLAYADFSAALKGALRDFHSTDLLARNPCCSVGSAISADRWVRWS